MGPKVRLLTRDEFSALDDARMELAKQKEAQTGQFQGASLWEVSNGECVMWECPWYYDPENPEDIHGHFLSRFYYEGWKTVRPPLCVLCPNGREWCVDQKSSNGEGWVISFQGDWKDGLITCTPSIVVPGYHGFLGTSGAPPGYFTDPL